MTEQRDRTEPSYPDTVISCSAFLENQNVCAEWRVGTEPISHPKACTLHCRTHTTPVFDTRPFSVAAPTQDLKRQSQLTRVPASTSSLGIKHLKSCSEGRHALPGSLLWVRLAHTSDCLWLTHSDQRVKFHPLLEREEQSIPPSRRQDQPGLR